MAIAILSHNYGRFLAEAIESALWQTVPAAEILVVDDGSTDETAAVAARFADRGVRYLRVDFLCPHKTQHAAFQATSADVLCFLDADDILPPDYLAQGLPAFADESIGLVYSNLELFGDRTGIVDCLKPDEFDINRRNVCHAASLVRRTALVTSDAWRPGYPQGASQDWWLWRAVARAGWKLAKSPARLRYRRHPQSWLATGRTDYFTLAGLAAETVTVIVPRDPELLEPSRALRDWIIGQTWPREQLRFTPCDPGQETALARNASTEYVLVPTEHAPAPDIVSRLLLRFTAEVESITDPASGAVLARRSFFRQPWKSAYPALRVSASPRPLRIGLLSPVFAVGGVERWALSLARHWAKGDRIRLAGIALTEGAAIHSSAVAEAREMTEVYGPSADAAARLAAEVDILLAWGHRDLDRHVAGFAGPVVQVAHGTGDCTEWTLHKSAPLATHLAACGRAAATSYAPEFEERVRVILNGIDLDRCRPRRPRAEIRGDWRIPDGALAIGHVGRWSPEKHPLAAALAAAAIPGAVAVYAHPHFAAESIQDAVCAAAVDRQVFFLPAAHVGDVYAALDCFVLASDEEGCSLALLEAFAAGVPVVATRTGALPELEGRHGLLSVRVPKRATADELARGVRLATSPRNAARVARAQRVAREHFTAARMADEWAAWLCDVVART